MQSKSQQSVVFPHSKYSIGKNQKKHSVVERSARGKNKKMWHINTPWNSTQTVIKKW